MAARILPGRLEMGTQGGTADTECSEDVPLVLTTPSVVRRRDCSTTLSKFHKTDLPADGLDFLSWLRTDARLAPPRQPAGLAWRSEPQSRFSVNSSEAGDLAWDPGLIFRDPQISQTDA